MNASFASCFVTLLKTSIGSGALSFPYLFKTYGIVTATFLTIISGLFAVIGLLLYINCAKEIGRDATLSELAHIAMPYTRTLVDFSVFLKCFGVALSYLIIAKQLLPDILYTTIGYRMHYPNLLLILFLFIISPFCYVKKLDKLKYTSFCGIFAILIVILSTIYRYKYMIIPVNTIKHYITPVTRSYLNGFGKFVFSFTCHQNIFTIHSEIKNNSFSNMKKLIYSVSISALILYIAFGYFNYMIYGQLVRNNIITNYPNDLFGTTVRFLYVIVMGVSYPLQVNPCRIYLLKMSHIKLNKKMDRISHILASTLIIIFTYYIAASGLDLGMVYAIIGATASTFICLIFPSLVYFNMDVDRHIVYDILGYMSFLWGIFVFISTIFSVISIK